MTETLAAPTLQLAGIAPPTIEARRMQQLRTRGADDHLAMYRAGFYVTTDRQTNEFHWDRRDERYIVPLDAEVADKARHIMKKEVRVPVRCSFNAQSAAVLDHLQDAGIKPRTWVGAEVRRIYEELIAAGSAFTMEACHEGQLVGGLVGIAVGSVAVIDTMYGLPEPKALRSASKALLCHAVIEFNRVGATCIDVQNQHPENHPWQRLGETRISMDGLRCLFARQCASEVDVVAAMAGWNSDWAR